MHTHQRPSMPGQLRAKFVAETPRTNPTKQGLLSGGTMELAPGFRVDIKYMTMGQYYMHTRVSTDTYTHIHIHTHTYTHIYTHTHTHTRMELIAKRTEHTRMELIAKTVQLPIMPDIIGHHNDPGPAQHAFQNNSTSTRSAADRELQFKYDHGHSRGVPSPPP